MTSEDRPPVLVDIEGSVGVVTLNRPHRANALNPKLLNLLAQAWDNLRSDPDVRVIVLTGSGGAFCAGADLDELLTAPPSMSDLLDPLKDLRPDRGLYTNKPVVAAVDGHCLGGGMTLLLSTDVRFATSHATFAVPEVGWGVIASCGGTQRLLRQVPHAVGMEMLLSGRILSADEAVQWGLVNEVVDEGSILDHALSFAHKVSTRAPLAVQATKELALRSQDVSMDVGLRLEDLMVRLLQGTEDAKRGLEAWDRKVAPQYRGT